MKSSGAIVVEGPKFYLKVKNMKKVQVLIIFILCVVLLSSCSNSINNNQTIADNIVISLKTATSQDAKDDIVLVADNNHITKQDFICFCKFNSAVFDNSDYKSQEIIEETIQSIALAKEAEQREIKIPDEKMDEINGYTDEYVQNNYGNDYPLETYKEICKISYLKSEIANQIQEEIISGEISIDDKSTRDLCKKFISYSEDVSSKSEDWSDECKLEELKRYYELYDEVESSYINYLIVNHLATQ